MKKLLLLTYGTMVYLFSMTVFLYAIAFTGNLLVKDTIDSAPRTSVGAALVADSMLLLVCALLCSYVSKPGLLNRLNSSLLQLLKGATWYCRDPW